MDDSPPRPRSSAATKEAILIAARRLFTERGYQGVGVRDIAAAAGVNLSLVNRYFGSKEGLFEAAVPAAFGIEGVLPDQHDALAAGLAAYVAHKGPGSDGFDVTLAMIRSAGDADAARRMAVGLEERFVGPLADWLGGPDRRPEAAAIVAILAGFAVMRDVLKLPSLQDPVVVERLLSHALAASAQIERPGGAASPTEDEKRA